MKLITPSKVPFLLIAFLIDLINFFLPFFDFIVPGGGTFLSFVFDFIAFLIFALWLIVTQSSTHLLKQKILGSWGKLMGTTFVESLPLIGDICPSWTFLVLSTQIGSPEEEEINEA